MLARQALPGNDDKINYSPSGTTHPGPAGTAGPCSPLTAGTVAREFAQSIVARPPEPRPNRRQIQPRIIPIAPYANIRIL